MSEEIMDDKYTYRYSTVKKYNKCKDGTLHEYMAQQRYKVKNLPRSDGTPRARIRFTDEQKIEIVRRFTDGVTIKRLSEDYNAYPLAIKKVINESKANNIKNEIEDNSK